MSCKLNRVFLLIICAMVAVAANANGKKTMLILDSYHEDELWGNSMVQPILTHFAHSDTLRCETMYLNCASVPNDSVYRVICNNVFDAYSERHPDYVIMIGNFAFNLRDRIKEEWGDLPILIITRSEGFGPIQDYFIKNSPDLSMEIRTPLSSVRNEYNFTCIFVPDYTHQTVDLMMSLIPEMDKLVFLGDESYVNQVLAFNVYNYLLESYPTVNFKWVKASEANADGFSSYLSNRDPKLGLLLSSWTYETESTRGYPVLTVRDLNMVANSVNPVFTTRLAYMSLGCIGGIFSDFSEVQDQCFVIIEEMLSGKSMRDIPFYYPKKNYTAIDYPQLAKYGLNEKNCPKDTVFISRPQSYLEKYWLVMCIVGVLVLVSLVLLIARISAQRRKIDILKRHSGFINNMPIPYTCAVITVEMGGKIKSIKYTDRNLAFEKLIGDNYASSNTDRVLPDEELLNLVEEIIATKNPVSFTYHFEHTDTYYDFNVYPIEVKEKSKDKNKDNVRELYVDIFVLDITDIHKLQMSLEESANVLDMAIEVTNLLPYKLNINKKTLVFDISNSLVSNFDAEYSSKTIQLEDYLTRIHTEDAAMFRETFEKLHNGEISKFCIQYRMYDENDPSKIRWFDNRGAVIKKNADGNPEEVIGTLRNITETKDHEQAMAVALAKAEDSDRMKSTFLANMSHEIRTPLNAIVGFSSMMIKEKDEKTKAKLADVINKNNDLLLTLINDVLDLAKIESNTIELNMSAFDINDLIDSISKTMSIRLPKEVKLNTVFFFDKCVVETDVSRLSQVLINLLTNACKFTKKGSITMGYELRMSKNMLYFFVRDTGIGIKPENQAKVFEQFVKLNSFAQGTGLGLAISRRIIEKMGGEIGVESEGEGLGSKFWFTLPYKPVELIEMEEESKPTDDEDINNIAETIEMPETESDYDSNGNLKPLILVAEDNESNYWLMKHLLSPLYRTINAVNGKEAVAIFKKLNPDIIIMDINMPEMDGYKAVENIRKYSATVPIIAVTAYAFASDRIRILNSGFDAYVPKPVTEVAIISAINQVTKK